MLCQVCQKRDAVMKITKLLDGAVSDYSVCRECAGNVSSHHAKITKSQSQTVQNLLKELLAQGEAAGAITVEGVNFPNMPACSHCGLDFLKYKQTFMLGCPHCYDEFGEFLLADIRKVHNATQHIGERLRTSVELVDMQGRLRQLKQELDESIREEDFERAVRVRDQIRTLQREQEARIQG